MGLLKLFINGKTFFHNVFLFGHSVTMLQVDEPIWNDMTGWKSGDWRLILHVIKLSFMTQVKNHTISILTNILYHSGFIKNIMVYFNQNNQNKYSI